MLISLLAFGVLIAGAALAYPGGTWDSPSSAGYSFWHNFWCDLLSTVALNGSSNWLGALLSRLAFACFAFALYRFWPRAALLSGGATTAQRLGVLGAASLLAVACVPAASSQLAHGLAVVFSAGCSVAAVALLLGGLIRQRRRSEVALGLAATASALLCLAQYVYQGCFAREAASWLAGMQKITTALLLAFMLRLITRPEPAATR